MQLLLDQFAPDYQRLKETAKDLDIDITLVTAAIIPFTTNVSFDAPLNDHEKIICFGSTRFVKAMKLHGFDPGVFYNEVNFNYLLWQQMLQELLFNNSIPRIKRLNSIKPNAQPMYCRPLQDLKPFSATVIPAGETALEWVKRFNPDLADEDQYVLLDNTKKLGNEYRVFVVDGKIVTATQYKNVKGLYLQPGASPWVMDFAEFIIEKFIPNKTVALDIIEIETCDRPYTRLMEFSCFNCAGFYSADLPAILKALKKTYS